MISFFQTGNLAEESISESRKNHHQVTCYQDVMKKVYLNHCRELFQTSNVIIQTVNLMIYTIILVCILTEICIHVFLLVELRSFERVILIADVSS